MARSPRPAPTSWGARAELDDERYEAAVTRGRSAPLYEVVRLALAGGGEGTAKLNEPVEPSPPQE